MSETDTHVDGFKGFSTYDVTPPEALTLFEEARRACPVAHSDRLDGFHALLNYADVKSAALDWGTFSSQPSFLRPVVPRPPVPPIDFDPPMHTPWRAIFAEGANPRSAQRIEPAVRADVRRQLDLLADTAACDLVAAVAEPIPPLALSHLLGLGRDDLEELVRLTREMIAAIVEDTETWKTAYAALLAFGEREIARRREHPTDDFITVLAQSELDGRQLSSEEVSQALIAFLAAGHETTVSGLSSLLYDVISRPDVRDRLAEDPAAIPATVEESLRLHTPFYGFFRRATGETTVSGVEIPAQGDVYLCWAAANRDPSVYEDPVEFKPDRPRRRHMTFGFGIHSCVGAPVARMELKVVLEELLARFPQVQLDAGAEVEFAFTGSETCRIRSLPARLR